MHRPLGLPVGSVRALLLLGLSARALVDLWANVGPEPWLLVALVLAAASYFSARTATPVRPPLAPAPGGAPWADAPRASPPLGLPAGTIRTLFLLALAAGVWLWVRAHAIEAQNVPVVVVLGAFVVGVVGRWLLARARKPDDPGALLFDHLQALAALGCAAGLVVRAVLGYRSGPSDWIDPALASLTAYYFGAR